jgi:hypothetical protein
LVFNYSRVKWESATMKMEIFLTKPSVLEIILNKSGRMER